MPAAVRVRAEPLRREGPGGAGCREGPGSPVRAASAELQDTQRCLASGSPLSSPGWWPPGFPKEYSPYSQFTSDGEQVVSVNKIVKGKVFSPL